MTPMSKPDMEALADEATQLTRDMSQDELASAYVELRRENAVLRTAATASDAVPVAWDHRVYCICQSCEQEDPEAAVHAPADVGVMPDGTWLCEDCYRECDNREYGMIASDIDDFEYPDFADLPRPPASPRPTNAEWDEAIDAAAKEAESQALNEIGNAAHGGAIYAKAARHIAKAIRALSRPASEGERDTKAEGGEHPAERLWREIGLPEYFLGNGGTNHKLYAYYDAASKSSAATPARESDAGVRAPNDRCLKAGICQHPGDCMCDIEPADYHTQQRDTERRVALGLDHDDAFSKKVRGERDTEAEGGDGIQAAEVWTRFIAACENREDYEYEKPPVNDFERGFRAGERDAAKHIRLSVDHPKYWPESATPAREPDAAVSEEEWQRKFDLWFFRDLTDKHRKSMFSIFGYSRAMKDIATHGAQRQVLRAILAPIQKGRS